MVEAFIDESMSAPSSDEYFLAVVAVVTNDRRKLVSAIRKARRVPKLKVKSELKASLTPPQVIKKLLTALASDPQVSVIGAVWESKRCEVADYEKLYQQVVARCALMCVRKSKIINLIIDKRYTNKKRQQELELEIRQGIAVIRGNIVRIFQEDSQRVKELTAADFVAWAFLQHYCHGNHEFYNIIRARVAHLDKLSQ